MNSRSIDVNTLDWVARWHSKAPSTFLLTKRKMQKRIESNRLAWGGGDIDFFFLINVFIILIQLKNLFALLQCCHTHTRIHTGAHQLSDNESIKSFKILRIRNACILCLTLSVDSSLSVSVWFYFIYVLSRWKQIARVIALKWPSGCHTVSTLQHIAITIEALSIHTKNMCLIYGIFLWVLCQLFYK